MLLRMSVDKTHADVHGSGEPRRKRAPVDWEAVERDYRTAKFTQRELATKYGVTHAAVQKQIKARGWTKDLALQIKQATHARLVAELVDNEVAKGSQAVADTVLAAAEANTQIVLKHRRWLATLTKDAQFLRQRVIELAAGVDDLKDVTTAIGAVESLARTTKTLIDKERQAFALDSEVEQPKPAAPQDWQTLGLPDCQAALLSMLQGARK